MCRKPLSIRHEALHEVHWAFIAAVTRTTSSKHPNHASNSFLYYSGPVKENFIFISKKRRHEMMMKKKNFPSLRRKKKTRRMLSLYEIWMCMRTYWWASFNIKLSIGHRPYAHIVYCYLFSLTRLNSRSPLVLQKNAWNAQTHTDGNN